MAREAVQEMSVAQLRGMIGACVCYRGADCFVMEVLEDGPSLVLQDVKRTDIQDNKFGDPHRRVARTYTVPIVDEDGRRLHPEFRALKLEGC
ncbi:MAG TPA: hypothetical protein VKA64_01185 [Gammaproteobacteria bacterium]|nr:hypothetical protein [Gammaproteobacteria bacterium]